MTSLTLRFLRIVDSIDVRALRGMRGVGCGRKLVETEKVKLQAEYYGDVRKGNP